MVAAATSISYVLVYTPLKTRTSLATLVGAVPGALPPVIGWAAATGTITLPALVLFGIVFFWQMPHFLAIAWMYRDDYARAGIPLLPVLEPDGRRTGQQALLYAAALWPVSLLPALVGLADAPYSLVATCLGLVVHLAQRALRARAIAAERAASVPLLDHLSAAALGRPRRRSSVDLSASPIFQALNAIAQRHLGRVSHRPATYSSGGGTIRLHKRCMLAALTSSALFLTSYVIYHANTRIASVPRPGRDSCHLLRDPDHARRAGGSDPAARAHDRHAGLRSQFDRHVRIARWTLPLWLYVSVTGVVIYLMLYQLY